MTHPLFLRDISGKSQIMAQSKQANPIVDFTTKKEKKKEGKTIIPHCTQTENKRIERRWKQEEEEEEEEEAKSKIGQFDNILLTAYE